MSNLAKALSSLRWDKRMSVREFAKVLGISPATLCRIEKGENMDGKTLAMILTWLLKEASDE